MPSLHTHRVQLVVPPIWMEKLDAWRREHHPGLNRSATIRMLVMQALRQEEKKK